MITLRKLELMQDRVCARKLSIIYHDAALALHRGEEVSLGYLRSLGPLFHSGKLLPLFDGRRKRLDDLLQKVERQSGVELAFTLSDLSTEILAVLGAEPSDWDFTEEDGKLDASRRIVEDHILVLDRLRSPFNVGSVFRSADSFGIRQIILVEGTADPRHPRSLRTSRGTVDTVPYQVMAEEEVAGLLHAMPCFALELGGKDMRSFSFPQRGACVIGSEEMGVSPALLACCDQSLGRASIALHGTKGSLNVSVATGILLCNWCSL